MGGVGPGGAKMVDTWYRAGEGAGHRAVGEKAGKTRWGPSQDTRTISSEAVLEGNGSGVVFSVVWWVRGGGRR